MEESKLITTLVLTLFFYVIAVIVINRAILYKSYKIKELDENETNSKLPLIVSGNLSLLLSAIILFKSLMNFITFKISNDDGLINLFSISATVFILNIIVIIISYYISMVLLKMFIKTSNSIIYAVIWLVVNTIIILVLNHLYTLISSSNAFSIY